MVRFGRIADQLAILVLWNGADDTAMDAQLSWYLRHGWT